MICESTSNIGVLTRTRIAIESNLKNCNKTRGNCYYDYNILISIYF